MKLCGKLKWKRVWPFGTKAASMRPKEEASMSTVPLSERPSMVFLKGMKRIRERPLKEVRINGRNSSNKEGLLLTSQVEHWVLSYGQAC